VGGGKRAKYAAGGVLEMRGDGARLEIFKQYIL